MGTVVIEDHGPDGSADRLVSTLHSATQSWFKLELGENGVLGLLILLHALYCKFAC